MDRVHKNQDRCAFCGLESPTEKHHVVPRSKGGKVTTPTCHTCESFIHKTWSHNQLRDDFNTIEKILATTEFQKFLKWRLKQQPATYFHSAKNRSRPEGRYR